MTDILNILAIGLVGGIVVAILGPAFRLTFRGWRAEIPKSESGESILFYPGGVKILCLFSTLFFTAMYILWILTSNPPILNALGMFGIFGFFIVPSLILSVKTFGTIHLTRNGIDKRTAWIWTHHFFLAWSEIDSMEWGLSGSFILRSDKSKIVVDVSLNGIANFTDAIRNNLPRTIWEKFEPDMLKASNGYFTKRFGLR
jgi:hypothetical protein